MGKKRLLQLIYASNSVVEMDKTAFKFKVDDEDQKMFMLFDKDDSGALNINEFREAFQSLGIDLSSRNAKKLFKKVDKDGSGQVDMEEFIRFPNPEQEEQKIKEAFKRFDKDNNGYLTLNELKDAIGDSGSAGKAAQLFKMLDSDGNGR